MKFKDLQIGDTFEFAHLQGFQLLSGLEKGPWEKISTRKYRKVSDNKFVVKVGTIQVGVTLIEKTKDPAPEFEPGELEELKRLQAYKHKLLEKLPVEIMITDRWNEYREEAEHQEGPGYWEQFKTIEEVLADFQLYVENCE